MIRDRAGRVQAQAIQRPEDAFKLIAERSRTYDREHFEVIHLNARSVPVAIEAVSIGTLSASLVHPREVFKAAIVSGAAGIIVCHNHPSGHLDPSPEDIAATKRLVRVGVLVGIPVIDHLIFANGGYQSLKTTRPHLFDSKGSDE